MQKIPVGVPTCIDYLQTLCLYKDSVGTDKVLKHYLYNIALQKVVLTDFDWQLSLMNDAMSYLAT